jgi:hypothetical protein
MLKFVRFDPLLANYKAHRYRWLAGLALLGGLALSLAINASWWVFVFKDRPPQRFELAIPAGTAERVAAGEAVPSIPSDMVLVAGDTLLVRNEDRVSHSVGPFWIPAGTTATIPFDTPSTAGFSCSINPAKFIGIEVQPRADGWMKLQAVVMLGLPLAGLIGMIMLASVLDSKPDSNLETSGSR